uniref:NADPH-dependent diflavin oxidoreductase 1 n=1 Tax=Panagrellus redivivus TaxID=6233 RepID=A0A7E4V9Q0_PANRE
MPSTPLILYGTETGTARDSAEALVEALRICDLNPRLSGFDEIEFSSLPDEDIIVAVVATSGQGQVPSNMREFWRKMLARNLPANFFSKTKFAIAALGDSNYSEFNFAGKKFYRRMLGLGATELTPIVLCDDQHQNGADDGIEKFKIAVIDELLASKLYPEMVAFDSEKQLPPKYVIRYVDEVTAEEKEELAKAAEAASIGSDFFFLEVKHNERVTDEDHFQDTRLITFANDGHAYNPGDVAQVQPVNLSESVDLVLDSLKIDAQTLDREFYLEKSSPHGLLPPAHIIEYPTTLRKCFHNLFDIQGIPNRAFFKHLSRIATNPMEKERLIELADLNNLDDYLDYARQPRRSMAEVLRDFHATAPIIPIPRLFEMFPTIRTRSFSIASSHAASPQALQLLVARVEFKRRYRLPARFGLCSNFLARLSIGTRVAIRFKEGTMDFNTPQGVTKVCIATGTGVAPFRSVIAEAYANGDHMPIMLFFGCRGRALDYYFGDEWPNYSNAVVQPAFSRDSSKKVYVQDVLRENTALLGRFIGQNRVTFYVAGSSGQMPKDVRTALSDIVTNAGISSDGPGLVAKMELARLLQFETWF